MVAGELLHRIIVAALVGAGGAVFYLLLVQFPPFRRNALEQRTDRFQPSALFFVGGNLGIDLGHPPAVKMHPLAIVGAGPLHQPTGPLLGFSHKNNLLQGTL